MINYEIKWTNNSDFRTFQNYNKHTKSQKELYETIDHLRAHSNIANYIMGNKRCKTIYIQLSAYELDNLILFMTNQTKKIDELNKGMNSLKKSRKKWKDRYYKLRKELKKNDIQKGK